MTPISSLTDLNLKVKGHPNNVFFLVDSNTHEFCLHLVLQDLPDLGEYEILEVPPGEESKSLEVASQIWMAMLDLGADRHSLLVNVGGGVITDLGGFIASLFMRGIRFINVPTSLLAMVDAAHGGKTGVDLYKTKNAVGTFKYADSVILHSEFLNSLPEDQFRSGTAEMLKHGLIADREHWNDIKEQYPDFSEAQFIHSLEIKNTIVSLDFKESGLRKNLNFGHTLGHAFESYKWSVEEPILHGEAVAAGIICAAFLSYRKSSLPLEELDEIVAGILKIFGKLDFDNDDEVCKWLKHDKKNEGGNFMFILLPKIGEARFNQTITLGEVKEALDFYREL